MYVQNIGLPSPVGNGGTGHSNILPTNDLARGAAGLSSDHAGTLSVQRYIDAAAQIPQGAAITVAVVANTPIGVSWNDGLACGAIIVSFINSSGAVANLTDVTVLLQPY